ncbi:hypothetical protein [Kitasatospora sp. LaBMicrA B282]|uniref:hypothetical protein n=1 Tax=Kitasatospora sp. LaBMicrA B282 TaxID=3420949 RepID=UPI003D0FE2B7
MRARHLAAAGLLALALGASAAGPAAAANPVVIEPDPVTLGGQFAVFDGGNCDNAGGQASFHAHDQGAGDEIPTTRLGSLRGLMGAMVTVPEHARSGVYDVTITCTTTSKKEVTTSFTVHDPGKPDQQTSPGRPDQPGRPDDQPGRPDQSGHPGEPGEPGGPQGPTHAGLGGSTRPDLPETAAGLTLLATAGAVGVHRLRRRGSS